MNRIEALSPKLWSSQRWLILVLPCFFATLCQNTPAASYFVAKTGNDGNPGTSTMPFLTVQKGVNVAQAGDSVLVSAGTYSEDISSARSGTSGSPIILDGQGVARIPSLFISHQYFDFRNFTVAGKASGWWVFLEKGAHHCVLSNNVLDGAFNTEMNMMLRWNNPYPPSETPFGGNCASGCLVISNTFKRAIGTTVISVFGDTNLVYGNRLIDGDAVDWFHVWGRSNRIVGNLCSNLFVSGLDANHPDFFQAFGQNGHGAAGIIIESNVVLAAHTDSALCMFEGQDCPDLRDFTFRNNLFVGVSQKGTMACNNVYWYNNTFVDCSTNAANAMAVLVFTSATSGYTNDAVNSGHGCRAYNNIFLNCGGTNTDRGWYTFSANLTNVAADYNYVAKKNYQPVDQDSLHRGIGNLGGWSTWLWWEPHGVNGGNPLFVSPSKLDFRLGEGSPLIGAALPLNQLFQTDLRGSIRGVQWDIGAFEFQSGDTVDIPSPPNNLRVLRVSSP